MYTVYVSTVNDITDQLPDDQFANISASVQTITTGGSVTSTANGPVTTNAPADEGSNEITSATSNSLDPNSLAAAIVVSVMVLIGICAVALLLFIW